MMVDSAFANDGGITLGGSPRLLGRHPSVRMQSEVVSIDTDGRRVHVVCDFVFKNTGKACDVRMGFPDEGYGADDPDEESDASTVMKTPPKTTMKYFKSWINGRATQTKLVRADEPGHYWHTKTVKFGANQTLRVRDEYEQDVTGGVQSYKEGSLTARYLGYIFHTGASWNGPIGKTTLRIKFANPKWKGAALKFETLDKYATFERNYWHFKRVPGVGVVLGEPSFKPTVSGSTLTWVRQNWTPQKSNDIQVMFDFQGPPSE